MKKAKKWKKKTKTIKPSTQKILQGDCFEQTRTLKPNSMDALICDPPAGISIIGKDWDSDLGGAHKWIRWMETLFMEIHRVLKPGAHGLVWALPRTSHWTATALENAGFEVRDVINHLFGSGFPKSQNMAKAIDKHFGVKPEVVGTYKGASYSGENSTLPMNSSKTNEKGETLAEITKPTTPQAERWDGWGTGLKPSSENWILVRKPLSGSIVENVLKWGTGALNIDGCRIALDGAVDLSKPQISRQENKYFQGLQGEARAMYEPKGRWPANLVLSHHPECFDDQCHPECPVRIMDEQSGITKSQPTTGGVRKTTNPNGLPLCNTRLRAGSNRSDSGGASRFFYCSKPSVAERNAGCDELDEKVAGGYEFNQDGSLTGHVTMSRNTHPTVKPIALMKYLIKMITPRGGIVFDPFAGSGTTLLAARELGLSAIGIEREEEYVQIIKARLGGSCGAATGKAKPVRSSLKHLSWNGRSAEKQT